MENIKDKDKELEVLKKEVERIVGKKEIERIKKIVELSYSMDEETEYKITYNIVKGVEEEEITKAKGGSGHNKKKVLESKPWVLCKFVSLSHSAI